MCKCIYLWISPREGSGTGEQGPQHLKCIIASIHRCNEVKTPEPNQLRRLPAAPTSWIQPFSGINKNRFQTPGKGQGQCAMFQMTALAPARMFFVHGGGYVQFATGQRTLERPGLRWFPAVLVEGHGGWVPCSSVAENSCKGFSEAGTREGPGRSYYSY